MLEVPPNLNRNAKTVQEMGPPADTGAMLINYMCQRIGIKDLGESEVLDMGCGVRFSEAIINRGLPLRHYTGIEVNKKIIDFLIDQVEDERFDYLHFDIKNICYNPRGTALELELAADMSAALAGRRFDIICMFSVITHQQPDEALRLFRFLRRHVKPGGHMFFSAFIHDGEPDHQELLPEKPGIKSSFSENVMAKMLGETGWSIVSRADPVPDGMPIMWSYLCTCDDPR